jgi:hypothetical protein
VSAATTEIILSGAVAQTPPPLAAPFNPSFGDQMNTSSRGMPSSA